MNVVQQLGAALGVAVLVTVVQLSASHAALPSHPGPGVRELAAAVTHGLTTAFGVGALFALTAFVFVSAVVRMASPSEEARQPAGE